jgi:hypothetical protein
MLDRIVGIPLVAAFRLAPKRRRPDPTTIKRIGILKSAAVGDCGVESDEWFAGWTTDLIPN